MDFGLIRLVASDYYYSFKELFAQKSVQVLAPTSIFYISDLTEDADLDVALDAFEHFSGQRPEVIPCCPGYLLSDDSGAIKVKWHVECDRYIPSGPSEIAGSGGCSEILKADCNRAEYLLSANDEQHSLEYLLQLRHSGSDKGEYTIDDRINCLKKRSGQIMILRVFQKLHIKVIFSR